MKYGKEITYTPDSDNEDRFIIDELGFYRGQNNRIVRAIQESKKTSKETLLSDIISYLDVLSENRTKDLYIHIKADDYFHPSLIMRKYTEKKDRTEI